MSFDPKDRRSVDNMREWCKQAVMGEPVEHQLAMMPDGSVWHSVGDAESVSLGTLDYNGAIVIHNHPENEDGFVSFGSDDFNIMQAFPHMAELWAMTDIYEHYAKPKDSILQVSFGTAYNGYYKKVFSDPDSLDEHGNVNINPEDNHHGVMEWLRDNGYLDYWRRDL